MQNTDWEINIACIPDWVSLGDGTEQTKTGSVKTETSFRDAALLIIKYIYSNPLKAPEETGTQHPEPSSSYKNHSYIATSKCARTNQSDFSRKSVF